MNDISIERRIVDGQVSGAARLSEIRMACRYRPAWLLVAASPCLFALATWPMAGFGIQDMLRHLSLPIVAIELAVVLAAFADGFEPGRTLKAAPAWARFALATVIVIAFGTAITAAVGRPESIARTASSVVHLLFGLSLVHLFGGRWRPLRAVALRDITIGTLAFVVLLVAFVASIEDPYTYDWVHFRLGVTNVRQLGFYSVVGASAALGLALTADRERSAWLWLGAASVLLGVSYWSGTRSSLIAFVAAYCVSLRLFPVLRRVRGWVALAGTLATGLAIGLVHTVPHRGFGPFRMWESSGSTDPSSGRLEMWLGTWQVYLERPLFGFGESQFRHLVPEALGGYNHPHNAILQVLFQWGSVGGACCIALAAFVWMRVEKCARLGGAAALPAYLIVTSLLVYSLIEGTLYHPYPIAMLIVATAWTLTVPRALEADEGGRTEPDSTRIPHDSGAVRI